MPCRTTSWHVTSRVVQKSMFSSNRFTSIQGKTIPWIPKAYVPSQTFRVSFWHLKLPKKHWPSTSRLLTRCWDLDKFNSTGRRIRRHRQVTVSDFCHVLQEYTQWQLRHLLSRVLSQICHLYTRNHWSLLLLVKHNNSSYGQQPWENSCEFIRRNKNTTNSFT